ncbi:glycosyltransferase [Dysgonomonas sp. Marseille-P4677]|uniref:glycosyltransferase family 2 protein n=1 Tax=Dysgonomonas sp. Marseille-P4677 TaxID=2364790 RepID=UPI0019134A1C|nr:glycosyltransferase family 2 protein [Dysgonomonas sp. Marseille-P4677]MBK5721756.1 glycosyltransferase [Dysgonomonas sp. Marseille-P4677]
MKLTIITINYNNANGLRKTIESIISQAQADFEYIVIDGGSTDGSQNIIEEYSQHITYWVSEPDKGVYNAMNKGIRQANGEYVLFINSGDTICEDANLSLIMDQITGEDIVYFDLEICDKNNNKFIKTYPDYLDFKYFAEDSLPHMGSFIKKELLIKYGYYSEKMKIVSDWAFFMDAICLLNCSYKHVNSSFSTFYLDGISSDKQNQKELITERNNHISTSYKLYESIYKEWMEKKQELYKLKTSGSVRFLKKIGLLKWLKL